MMVVLKGTYFLVVNSVEICRSVARSFRWVIWYSWKVGTYYEIQYIIF